MKFKYVCAPAFSASLESLVLKRLRRRFTSGTSIAGAVVVSAEVVVAAVAAAVSCCVVIMTAGEEKVALCPAKHDTAEPCKRLLLVVSAPLVTILTSMSG